MVFSWDFSNLIKNLSQKRREKKTLWRKKKLFGWNWVCMSPKGDSNIVVLFWLVISKPDFALTLARPGHTRPNSIRPFGMTGYFACIGIVNRKWPKTFINMYTIDEPTDWLYLHSQCYQIASVTSALEWLDLSSWKCLLMKSMKSVDFSVTCKTSKKNFNDFYKKNTSTVSGLTVIGRSSSIQLLH